MFYILYPFNSWCCVHKHCYNLPVIFDFSSLVWAVLCWIATSQTSRQVIWSEIPLSRSYLTRVSYTSIDLSYCFLTRHDSTCNKDKVRKQWRNWSNFSYIVLTIELNVSEFQPNTTISRKCHTQILCKSNSRFNNTHTVNNCGCLTQWTIVTVGFSFFFLLSGSCGKRQWKR